MTVRWPCDAGSGESIQDQLGIVLGSAILEANETAPEQALRLELEEENQREIQELPLWFSHHDSQRKRLFLRAALPAPHRSAGAGPGGVRTWCFVAQRDGQRGDLHPQARDQPRPLAPSLRRAPMPNWSWSKVAPGFSVGTCPPLGLLQAVRIARFRVGTRQRKLIHLR